MSMTPSSTIVGAFRSPSAAEQAMGTLYHAGFQQEQICDLVPTHSAGFFEGLKSFFSGEPSGTGNDTGDPMNDLTAHGLSTQSARYYADQYSKGNTVLIVNTSGHEQEALRILQHYGAYDAEMKLAGNEPAPG